jgi:thioesterase domain-containing protein
MAIIDFIDELRRKGIEISYSGGKLKYSGPEENVTPDLIEKLKANKGKLIKYLWPKELDILMPINPEGNLVPLFVIHGDNGNYIISDYLGPNQPVYGFFHPGSEGEKIPYKSVRHMSSVYLEKILTVWPEGPYYLLGYSFGGLLAYDMAVQLQKMGKRVPFLVFIDTVSPCAKEPFAWRGSLYKTIRLNILRPWRRGMKHKLMYWKCLSYIYRGKPVPTEKRSEYLRDKYISLFKNYKPEKFNGELLLFKASETATSFKYLGWDRSVDHIRLVEIDGKHLDVFVGEERNELLRTEIEKFLNEVNASN